MAKNINTTKVEQKDESGKSSKEQAKEIVEFISQDINARSGLGAIWRQLNSTRKKEMLDKWEHTIEKKIAGNK